uniref:Uncharacterized protein n=1 Tax=Physcomitrium patens TaxID=3218 RepID=A0A2K1J1C3_PHYPA|nr:hypothetical protein PHYPA_023229 [Physcomitrium patens]
MVIKIGRIAITSSVVMEPKVCPCIHSVPYLGPDGFQSLRIYLFCFQIEALDSFLLQKLSCFSCLYINLRRRASSDAKPLPEYSLSLSILSL